MIDLDALKSLETNTGSFDFENYINENINCSKRGLSTNKHQNYREL